jgi:ribosomal protein S18 acetylase RimI-like enzyme
MTMIEATIRPAHAGDEAAVYAIYMHPAVVPFLGHDPMPPVAFSAVFRGLLDAGGFLVLEHAAAVAGFCRIVRQPGRAAHVAYLGTFAVDPALHGAGLARWMVEQLVERLQSEGVLRVELMVEADNARALSFYRRLGFVHEGTLRAAYKRAGETHYVDELWLGRLLGELAPAPIRGRDGS